MLFTSDYKEDKIGKAHVQILNHPSVRTSSLKHDVTQCQSPKSKPCTCIVLTGDWPGKPEMETAKSNAEVQFLKKLFDNAKSIEEFCSGKCT